MDTRSYLPGSYQPPDAFKVTDGKASDMRDDWIDATVAHLNEKKVGDAEKLAGALGRDKAQLPRDGQTNMIKDGDLERVFEKDLPRKLVSRAAVAMGQGQDETAEEVRDAYVRHGNHKDWKPVQKNIREHANDGQTLTSTITPVNSHFGPTFENYGTTGLGSMSGRLTPGSRTDDEKKRPTNLWHTQLKDRKGDELFAGFRSGAFIDTAAADVEKQTNNDDKLKGVLKALVVEKLSRMSMTESTPYVVGQKVLEGQMVSIDLLAAAGQDRSMADEHHATLQRLNNQVHTYPVKNANGGWYHIDAKFSILDFQTSVNAGNSSKSFGISKSSKEQAQHNAPLWHRLRTEALQVANLMGGAHDAETIAKREKIFALVQAIDAEGLGTSGSYQLPAMVANLGYLIGDAVHFNCKSGKDRTGIMDAESKFMARQLDRKASAVPNVSDPSERTGEQNDLHKQMLWESGSLEVLAQNVGGQCLKTADLAKMPGSSDRLLRENLGGSDEHRELGGLKRYADIDTIASFKNKLRGLVMAPMNPFSKRSYKKDAEKYMAGIDESEGESESESESEGDSEESEKPKLVRRDYSRALPRRIPLPGLAVQNDSSSSQT